MNNIINRRSLADEVALQLKEQITSGRYQVNDKLPIEPELMKTFGVGRSTIREAIKFLVNSGMLKVQQGIGTFVIQVTGNEPMDHRLKRANVQDLDEVRQILEMKIAERAAINRTEADIEMIRAHLTERNNNARDGMVEACVEADIRFHMAIAVASKNEILVDLYKSVSVHLKKWFLQIYTDTETFKETQYWHDELLKSIIEGNARNAWKMAEKIIGYVSQ